MLPQACAASWQHRLPHSETEWLHLASASMPTRLTSPACCAGPEPLSSCSHSTCLVVQEASDNNATSHFLYTDPQSRLHTSQTFFPLQIHIRAASSLRFGVRPKVTAQALLFITVVEQFLWFLSVFPPPS